MGFNLVHETTKITAFYHNNRFQSKKKSGNYSQFLKEMPFYPLKYNEIQKPPGNLVFDLTPKSCQNKSFSQSLHNESLPIQLIRRLMRLQFIPIFIRLKYQFRNIFIQLAICGLMAFPGPSSGQEMLGMVNGNYSGVNGLIINPSSGLNSHFWLDFNIAGAGIFGRNNHLYIPNEDFWIFDVLKSDFDLPRYGQYDRPAMVYEGTRLREAYTSNRLLLPSVMYADVNRGFALGLLLQSRFAGSGNRISYDVANFGWYGLEYRPQQNTEFDNYDLNAAALAWNEIGLNFATVIRRERFDLWTAGVTFKYLLGTAGFYTNVNNVRYVVLNDSTVDMRNLDAELGFSFPIDYASNQTPGPAGYLSGRGFAFDIGFTFIKTPRELRRLFPDKMCNHKFEKYKYKLGISLLDFGSVKFNDNAQRHLYDNVNHFWEQTNQLYYPNIQDFIHDLSERVYGNPTASLIDKALSIGLPTAISMQFDYHYSGNWFIHSGMVAGLPLLGDASVRRPGQMYVVPRYETHAFEASLPVSLYQFQTPRVGLALRFYTFTIGTEKLGTYLKMNNFDGMDLYFSLRIAFRKGYCPLKKSKTPCGDLDF